MISETLTGVAATVSVFWHVTTCSFIDDFCPAYGGSAFFRCRQIFTRLNGVACQEVVVCLSKTVRSEVYRLLAVGR